MNLTLGFIAKPNAAYPTGFWSLHGQTEVVGNAFTICIEYVLLQSHRNFSTQIEIQCYNGISIRRLCKCRPKSHPSGVHDLRTIFGYVTFCYVLCIVIYILSQGLTALL